jgi:hypothetical protein
MMLASIALAAALATTEVYTDDEGCRWLHHATSAAKPRPRTPAASAPAGKPVKHRKRKPPVPGDDLIGCDQDGMPVMRSDIEAIEMIPPEVPPEKFALVEPETPATVPPVAPGSFTEGCDCGGPVFFTPPSFVGGGFFVPPPTVPSPVPEPSALWMLMCGFLVMFARMRKGESNGR